MQISLIVIKILILFLWQETESQTLYLLWESDSNHSVIENKNDSSLVFYFYIDRLNEEFEEYVEPITFQADVSYKITASLPDSIRNIGWIRSSYITAFEGFQNKPIALNKSGNILSFDLNQSFKYIYILVKSDHGYKKFKAEQISILE